MFFFLGRSQLVNRVMSSSTNVLLEAPRFCGGQSGERKSRRRQGCDCVFVFIFISFYLGFFFRFCLANTANSAITRGRGGSVSRRHGGRSFCFCFLLFFFRSFFFFLCVS